MTDQAPFADQETLLELFAGIHPGNNQPIFEKVLATPLTNAGEYRLLKSPLFVRGLAALDTVKINEDARGRFSLIEHSGNLCVRVFLRQPNEDLEVQLTAEIEKLGGSMDIKTDRAIAYSIHFGVGFSSIEELLNKWANSDQAKWVYGNVYDPETGDPLNWWQALLQV
ncbi:DUF4265 domain-containing protein [Zhongshania borealis]|jgi:hypothetical protein|uniref:DUF4265 domain-containing protein n=1 Tax=Zhongshania borealis TaxID=889488 RepID=A0ABP7WP27_9GAMM|tara:strand:- start:351 stop:854 length:504 start_codon:yes stop_codon:yes gene_type:complete